ncbi:MAG: RNA-binding S4 domain-containing protein [Acidobacteria bacterium]|nr:MAG: RNA-binding S4 domain-containing protein [Acidobacteriota bacterium]REK11661.1 MAG: RNA-binding S4 domain-containing protein [Acidobacteriota bacterium]
MSVRVDKWLQVARVFKTRTAATRACTLGRVSVNGARAKPHKTLELEDTVQVEMKHGWERILIVKELRDKTLPKEQVSRIFEDQSLPRPQLSEMEKQQRRPPVQRDPGAGRPTKRDRRRLDRLRG